MDLSAPKSFPWIRLPKHIQQEILSYVVLPDGPHKPLVIGNQDHRDHVQNGAVPIFLALGSWISYVDAMSILYREVHMDISVHRRSSVTFLTSPGFLGPRCMVSKLRMYFDIKKSLPFFDTGHTIAQSKGKLIKMNAPTALRCMKVHGRLSEVEFFIDNSAASAGMGLNYLPMAEMQLVSRESFPVSGNCKTASGIGVRPNVAQAETVIAPAFLACRAWQSGFLPLLEDGAFQHGASLGLVFNGQDSDQGHNVGNDSGNLIVHVDGANLMRYWLGGTIVELLDGLGQHSSWIDPFTLAHRQAGIPERNDVTAANPCIASSLDEDAVIDSIELDNDRAPSPTKGLDSSLEASSRNRGHSASHDDRRPSTKYQAYFVEADSSDGEEISILHQRFGMGSSVRANRSPVSPSRSGSPKRAGVVPTCSDSTESPSNQEFEVFGMVSQESVSLGEDHDVDSIGPYLTDSSGPDPREEEAPETPKREVLASHERSSPEIIGYKNATIQSLPTAEDGCASTSHTNKATKTGPERNISGASRRLLNETLNVRLRDASETAPTSLPQATRSGIPSSSSKDLSKEASGLDIVESEDIVMGRKASLPRIDGQAESSAAARKIAKKAAKKEAKKKKREAKSRTIGDSVDMNSIDTVSQMANQAVLATDPTAPTPQPSHSVQNDKSKDGGDTLPCSASASNHSDKRRELASHDETSGPSQHSHHSRSRRRARELKEKQLGLLKNLEALAWEREQTLMK
ncbi:hypothetical protein Daus18300_011161 [Diaporthe australafricana]|uniref:F-box domain-containing protein n=1 Tax=Diaporthe australafricana TaxID=127596 RepID=A0ABR3W7L0_9PEZI